jgi:hypothetical protein
MATGIKIENGLLQYKGKKIPLISGEFHYWRVPRENWPVILERIREMGLGLVSSYIPWNYHELAPGKYDFTGKTSPQRDLVGFIELLKAKKIYLIIRPGPYIYAEWPYGGPPERAVKHDRLSPEFLAMAKDYIDAACKVLVPRQITRGGNIVICQADNEPYPLIESFGNEIGCFKDKGLFKDWLRKKYNDDLDLLNRRWQTSFASFDDACFYFHEECVNVDLPMAQRLLPDREYYMRYTDCFEFIGWYAAKIIGTVGGWLRDAGVDVPIFANSWSPLYADFSKFCEVADLAGTDIYPARFMEGAVVVKDHWMYNIDIIKMSEADVTNGNVWSAEFQSGAFPLRDVGYLPASHFRFIPLALMARGLKGWNWYMLVNRDGWSHGPINEWGRTNEYFPEHAKAVAAAKAIEPWNRQALNDVSLLVYKPHRVIAPGNFDEVFYTLEQGDISYSYYNPQSGNKPDSGIVLYSGSDWIDAESAAKLEGFVRDGGTLITFSRYPSHDDVGKRLDAFGFQPVEGARPVNLPVTVEYRKRTVTIANVGHMGCKVNFSYFRDVPGEPIRVTLSTKAKELLVDVGAKDAVSFAIGYAIELGKGKIIHIGSNPSAAILRMILDQEGLAPYASSDDPRISTSLHRHHDGSLALFVINRNDEPRTANVHLNLKRLGMSVRGRYAVKDVTTGCTQKMSGKEKALLAVPVAGHDAVVRIIR